MIKITDYKVSEANDRYILTRKLSTGKWEIAGTHKWVKEEFDRNDGSTGYKRILSGPWPEITRKLIKRSNK